MAISIGELTAKISVNAKDFKAGLDLIREEVKKLDRIAADAGKRLTVGLTLPIAAVGAASIKASRDMDSLRRGMVAVTGSAARAAREMEKLKGTAQLPGLGFADAVKGSTRLQAAGASADQARLALEGFGNAIATVGGGKAELDGVTLALTQILASGKVLGQEVRQLQQRIPQIRQVMIAAFGTARSEEIQKLGISADQFLDKVTSRLLELPKVTGGVRNAFENLGDSLFRMGAAIGDSLLPVVIPLIESLAVGAEKMGAMEKATIQWAVALAAVAAAAGPVLLLLNAMAVGAVALSTALSLGLGTVLLGGAGVVAALGLGTAALIKWGLSVATARSETEKFVDALEELPEVIEGRIFATGGAADEIAKLFARMRRFIEDRPDRGERPAPPLGDHEPLRISAEMLKRLTDRASDLRDEIGDLEMALVFEEDAEAAKTLISRLETMRRELERVNDEVRKQQLGGAAAGVSRGQLGSRDGFIPDLRGRIRSQVAVTSAGLNLDEFGDELGDIGKLAGRAAKEFGTFGSILSSIIAGISEGGLVGIGSAAISAVGAALSSIFGGPDIFKENTEAIRQNTEAIKRTLATTAGGRIAGVSSAITAAIQSFAEGNVFFLGSLERELAKFGLTLGDARALAADLGIELNNHVTTWQQLLQVLQSRIFDDFVGKMDLARRRIQLLDIESPLDQFAEFQRALASSLPGGIGGLGISVARLTPETIDAFVRGILDQISAGTFDFGRLGPDVSIEDFLNALAEMESLADAAGEAADEINGLTGALRNAPAGFKVALSWFNATVPVTGGGSPTGPSEFNIENLTVVASDPDEMLVGLEAKVRRQARRGGVTGLDLSVKPTRFATLPTTGI